MASASTDLTQVAGLQGSLGALSDQERELAAVLLAAGQAHLFEGWPASPADDEQKHRFFEQVRGAAAIHALSCTFPGPCARRARPHCAHVPPPSRDSSLVTCRGAARQVAGLNRSYPGGISAYVANARKLLAASMAGENPFEGYAPEVPVGRNVVFGDEEFAELEGLGVEAMRRSAFVLVAGGLGERLVRRPVRAPPGARAHWAWKRLAPAGLQRHQGRPARGAQHRQVLPAGVH